MKKNRNYPSIAHLCCMVSYFCLICMEPQTGLCLCENKRKVMTVIMEEPVSWEEIGKGDKARIQLLCEMKASPVTSAL